MRAIRPTRLHASTTNTEGVRGTIKSTHAVLLFFVWHLMRFFRHLWNTWFGAKQKRLAKAPDPAFAPATRVGPTEALPANDFSDFVLAHTDFAGWHSKHASSELGVTSSFSSAAQLDASKPRIPNPIDPLAQRTNACARDRFALSAAQPEHFALVYASRAVSAEEPHTQLRQLRKGCAQSNAKAGLSSALVLQDGMFCQWLQGEQAAVEACFARIKRDSRHMAIMVLFAGPASACMLDHWGMGMRSMYLAHGAAFKRAQRLRLGAKAAAYATPLIAWLKLNGALVHEALPPPDRQVPELSDPLNNNSLARLVCLIAVRSGVGAAVLSDAAKDENLRLAVTRWGAADDGDCDLQVAAASLTLKGRRANMLAVSGRSLRVGIVREVVRSAAHWVLLLREDDVGELDQLIDDLCNNMPPGHACARVTVIAPNWRAETKTHAQTVLHCAGWQAELVSFKYSARSSWQALAQHLG